MRRLSWLLMLGLLGPAAMTAPVFGQQYIGYAYPAGGQQGTTVQVRLGGQRLQGSLSASVSGEGVSVKFVDYFRRMSPQDMTLMREQEKELRPAKKKNSKDDKEGRSRRSKPVIDKQAEIKQKILERIDERQSEYCNRANCRALEELVFVEVTISPDAKPGKREIRVITETGVSNPVPFYISQYPEVARKAMKISPFQVLGKENLAQRKRPPEEVESTVSVPCVMNGQIAPGEINRYRFMASKGQRLVISVKARDLVPYIADAVPGWFQPVMTLYNSSGQEVAYSDDYRFDPDPVILYDVEKGGEHVLEMTDSIYRGREDFIYRITVAEAPFITSIYPLGGRIGDPSDIKMDGWNLDNAKLIAVGESSLAGIYKVAAEKGGIISNTVPFARDTLPEEFDNDQNDSIAKAQKITLPVNINGRSDRPGDRDIYEFTAKAGDTVVAEVLARQLDSPLDSVVKITDAHGKLIAVNDDKWDAAIGSNTHHADSYISVKLPAAGTYYVHLTDVAQSGGPEYGYRLRVSPPRPNFELRTEPSRMSIRNKRSGYVKIYSVRKDGYNGPIKVTLKDPPKGFSSSGVTIAAGKEVSTLTVKTTLFKTDTPVALNIIGTATIDGKDVTHQAVAAEDKMQAFLWRHLLPAEEFVAYVYNPDMGGPVNRPYPPPPVTPPKTDSATAKFTKRQVQGRMRQLKSLYQEWLLMPDFYNRKMAECEAALDD